MLNRFTVENFLSFRDRVELSMIAGKSTRLPSHVQLPSSSNDFRRLKSAVIYGANASGKTNLVRGLEFVKKLVLVGTKPERRIPIQKFKLGTETKDTSRFETEFFLDGKNYAYGFVIDEKIVHEEWLYQVGRRSEQQVFSRKYQDGRLKFTHPGIKLSDEKETAMFETLAEFCAENQLFSTEYKNARRRIHSHISRDILKPLEDLIEWFSEKLTIIFPDSINIDNATSNILDLEKYDESVSKIINCFDTGIIGIEPKKVSRSLISQSVPDDVLSKIEADIEDNVAVVIVTPRHGDRITVARKDGEIQFFKISAEHENPGVGTTLLDFADESDGTKRLFDLVPAYIKLISEKDSVLIIDEIDRSLHTQIASTLLQSFNETTAQSGGQLIVTTHETNLLDQKVIRKDEIWFVNKRKGVSSVYSLEEYLPRYDKDIRSAYLKGRFGAVPIIYDNPSEICKKVALRDATRAS